MAVRVSLNALAPINRLPVELLTKIFYTVYKSSWKLDPRLARAILWPEATLWAESATSVTLSLVCRHWRMLALGYPLLWVDVSDRIPSSPGKSVFLERSKGLPLNVRMMKPRPSELAAFVQAEGHRIRELHIATDPYITNREIAEQMLANLDFDADKLEYLTVRTDSSVPVLFRGRTPRLRRLTLVDALQLPPNQFSTLTHLALILCSIPGTQIISLLSHTPALQELIILGPILDPVVSSALPIVVLAKLQLLVLNAIDIKFFSQVSVNPLAAILILDQNGVARSGDNPNSIAVGLSQIDAIQAVTTLSVDMHRQQGLIMLSGTDGASLPAVRLQVGRSPWSYTDMLEFTSTAFPSSQIRELWFGVQGFQLKIPPEFIRGLLRSMPALETFAFHKQYLEDVISILCDEDSSDAALLCPDLHTIRIVGANPWSFRPAAIMDFANRLVRARPNSPVSRIIAGKVLNPYEFANENVAKGYSLGVVGPTALEFEGYDKMPSPPMPDICRTESSHRLWRPW